MTNGYEVTYRALIPLIDKVDFAEAAPRLGFTLVSKDSMEIDFLGRRYELRHSGVKVIGADEDANVNFKSVLIYYAISRGAGEPDREYSIITAFSGGLISGNSGTGKWLLSPLTAVSGGSYERFRRGCEVLGARFISERNTGEYLWEYELLPKIPVQLVFFEADDEFPAETRVKYSNSAARWLEYEPLCFLNGCLASAFARAVNPGA